MQEQAKSALTSSAPWRRGVAWPIVAIEGLVLLGLGIYMLADTEGARDVVLFVIGAVLLVNGALEILAAFRTPELAITRYRLIRGTSGVIIGGLVVLEPISDDLDKTAARFILAVGLFAYGIIGLAATVINRNENGIRIGALVASGLCIVLGILFLTGDEGDSSRVELAGVIGLVFGVLLLAYAFYLYRGKSAEATASATPPVTPEAM
jgi:uncharacterized membrane protein HdeD (DUF308 family)